MVFWGQSGLDLPSFIINPAGLGRPIRGSFFSYLDLPVPSGQSMLAYCQTDDDGYLRSGPGSPGYTRGGPRSPGRPRSPGPPALPGPSGVRKRKSRDDMCLRGHHVVKVGSRAVSLKFLNENTARTDYASGVTER